VKVVETGRQPGTYVALSHCWGTQQIITTRTENIEDHKKAIDFQQLSKTFQDAVTVTRKLGQRFLWIDSLCIIQNSAEDWAKESSYMGDIYLTATFTISAAGAVAGAIGCFMPRTPPLMDPITIQYLSSNLQLESIHIGLPRGSLHSGLDDGPLQSRAWCLQERVLSRRNIHFCQNHIVWECQMTSIAENGEHLDGASGMEAYQLKLQDKIGTSSHLKDPLQSRFRKIVQDYTHRGLTKPFDKFPAISGLAQKIHQETGDKYVAGLWYNHLHNDL
ncbi:HET-domain-containing protein, partial [Rhizodiscina lignyota]